MSMYQKHKKKITNVTDITTYIHITNIKNNNHYIYVHLFRVLCSLFNRDVLGRNF
jgi:hypothetical protein